MDISNNPSQHHKRFTSAEAPLLFEQAIALRREVFVNEQGGPLDEEPDAYDGEALQWVFYDSEAAQMAGQPVATCRLVPYQEGCQMKPVAKLGRLAVRESARGSGWGRVMMATMMASAREAGFDQAILHAQSYATGFYEKLGFVAEGGEFEEGGIPHILMRRVLVS